MAPSANYLLNLHYEMEKFEALYLELHTHVASRVPGDMYTAWNRETPSEPSLNGANEEGQLDSRAKCIEETCHLQEQVLGVPPVVREDEDMRRGSMTNLYLEPETPCDKGSTDRNPQEVWGYLTQIALIFNRMRFFLVS